MTNQSPFSKRQVQPEKTRRQRTRRRLAAGLILLVGLLIAGVIWVFWDLPSIDTLSAHLAEPSVRITDRNGRLLYELLPEQGGRHAVLPAASMPECIKQATIAVEDRNFYQNPGVDPEGILRALWIDIRGGETIAGGSTITQQVARLLLLSQEERTERSLRRKLRESVLAWELANRLSKDEILALYLNQTYYGGMAYGVEAAAETFFGKPASELLLSECALLAGLPQSPGVYNPFTNPDLATARRSTVLQLMEKAGYIQPTERAAAEQAPLYLNPAPYPIQAPHFVWMVRQRLDELIAAGAVDPRQSLVVRTTLDLDLQQLAEQVIARQIESFHADTKHLSQNVNNAALVALDPRNGEILALVGSAGYFDETIHGAVDMANAPRQPGSAFKPFIYVQALDPRRAHPWTAATILMDVSTSFVTHDQLSYTPVNYDNREHGPIPVRTALASSLNIPAVLTLREVGIDNTIQLARHLGINTLDDPDKYDLSLALGGGQMSLLDLSTAYGALAHGGIFTEHTCLLEIRDPAGKLLYAEKKSAPVQVLDPRAAWLIDDILSDDRARMIGFGRNSTLKLDRTAAVKTGTTTNYHDNWTVGYTPEFLAGVWVGNSDYQAMYSVTGLTGAAPIWHEFIRAALQGRPDVPFPQPEGFVTTRVCDLSGLLVTPACPNAHTEWFIDGTQPTTPDTVYRRVEIDLFTGRLATPDTPTDRRMAITALDLPPVTQSWARAQGLTLLADLESSAGNPVAGDTAPWILSPPANAVYQIRGSFDETAQQLAVSAGAGREFVRVALWADGNQLAEFDAPPYQAWWPLAAGTHSFWAVGTRADGKTVISPVVTITVLVESPEPTASQ
jgi:penicillin-binding protein 1C